MSTQPLLVWLSLLTIALVLAWGIWQYFGTRHSQSKRGEEPGSHTATLNKGPSSTG